MQKSYLNWKSLLDDRCPKCGCKIFPDVKIQILKCALYGQGGRFDCDFTITPERKNEIVKSMGSAAFMKRLESQDNLSDLNNLGRKEVSEDFSDSI